MLQACCSSKTLQLSFRRICHRMYKFDIYLINCSLQSLCNLVKYIYIQKHTCIHTVIYFVRRFETIIIRYRATDELVEPHS